MNTPDFFTVILVPHARAKFRKYQIPLRVARVAGRAAAAIGVLALLAGTHYVSLLVEVRDLRQVKAESADLLGKTRAIEADAQALRTRLGQLQGVVTKLGVMAGVDAPPDGGATGGLGGASSIDQESVRASSQVESLEEMTARLDKLTEKSAQLSGVLENQRAMLATTPSIWPVRGYLSAGFGNRIDPFTGLKDFHPGLDISAPLGTKIQSPADGVVIFVGEKGGYGNAITVSHGRGLVTHYGHLDGFNVRVGQQVRRGSVLGYVGSTGRSTAPHLHYEVWVGGANQNPLQYILDEYRSLG
jgi:murein DD-endopeptidase MepM/ murein hydrolase activator NlpD